MSQAWKKHIGKVKCPRCANKYAQPEFGFYDCRNCGFREKIEYALVRTCYENMNGVVTVKDIAAFAGIPENQIAQISKELGLKLDELENSRHACKKCGSSIMFGRFCQKCKKDLLGGLR